MYHNLRVDDHADPVAELRRVWAVVVAHTKQIVHIADLREEKAYIKGYPPLRAVVDAGESMESAQYCQAEAPESDVLPPAWRRVSMSRWMSGGMAARIVNGVPVAGCANVIASACSA